MSAHGYIDISHIRVHDGQEERFIEIWARVVAEWQEAAGGDQILDAHLLRPVDGDVWADVWRWRSKADADRLMSSGLVAPSWQEMDAITDLVKVDWYEVAGRLEF